MTTIPTDDPLALAATEAIHSGNVAELERLLADHPALATARLGGETGCARPEGMTRTLLHVTTDWPGNYPNGAATVAALTAAGADVNARFTGPHTETPLHWAASSDDVEVLDALLDAGADIEANGAVIGGGTPLDDAVAFGQWTAARRLVERGATPRLWHAAALGRLDLVERYFVESPPAPDDVTEAFWQACHGGQRATAEFLLARGADRDWIGYDGLTPYDVARRSGAGDVADWLKALGAVSARAGD
jgi:uncharacterized protein